MNGVFAAFEGVHAGETAVLLATGPSLNKFRPIRGNVINVGVNSIVMKEDVELDYYFFGDRPLPKDKYNYFDFIGTAKIKRQKFCHVLLDGKSLKSHISIEESKKLGALPYEMTLSLPFRKDISAYRPVNYSIVFAALQFILYTGVERVYLVGCDVSRLRGFVRPDLNTKSPAPLLAHWKKDFKSFVTLEYPEVKVISINPVNLEGLFTDEYQE